MARRFHNDAVRAARALRRHRTVRLLRLAGHARSRSPSRWTTPRRWPSRTVRVPEIRADPRPETIHGLFIGPCCGLLPQRLLGDAVSSVFHRVRSRVHASLAPRSPPSPRHRHRPRQARHGRAAQGRRDHATSSTPSRRRSPRTRAPWPSWPWSGSPPTSARTAAWPDVRPQHDRGDHRGRLHPVMAKSRIGHFVEAQVLQSLGVGYIDESEVLTPADGVNPTATSSPSPPLRLRRHQPGRGPAPYRRGRGHDPLEGRGRHRQRRRGRPPPAPDQERDRDVCAASTTTSCTPQPRTSAPPTSWSRRSPSSASCPSCCSPPVVWPPRPTPR